jgi:predicted Zn-dependent protease
VARADALIDEAKGGAMAIINTNRPSFGPSGMLLDPETLLLGMRGGEEASMETPGQINDALHQYELALARRPDSGILHAAYASALSEAGFQAPPSERADLFQRARAEAELTIRDHHAQSGLAYLTLLQVAQTGAPRDLLGAAAQLDKTLKAAPETDWLLDYACGFRIEVGRARDGLTYCQRALALSPHGPQFTLDYAVALDQDAEQPQLADQLLDEGARLYPGFVAIRAYRFMREAFAGSPDKALALLHDPATAPPVTPDEVQALVQLQTARKSGARNDADAAMTLMRRAEEHFPSSPFRVLFPMALGQLDDAFAHQDELAPEDASNLMVGFTDRLRRDARFWPLAAKYGLVRYWITTDKWPDFCSDPSYPLNCANEARKVAATQIY